jgi:preprotein translocase subunit SecE
MKGLLEYLRNSRAELGRVTWPTRAEVIQSTQATVFFVFLTILFLLFADFVLGTLIRFVLGLG